MERNSDRPLSLPEIARACGVSRSHLAHAFGTATGMPVMRYLRNRRLSPAATALAGGAPDILAVALDAGYGSHEAFTRAFGDRFGLTPEAVRERGTVAGLDLTEALELPKHDTALPPLSFVEQDALLVVGLSAPYAFDNTIGIPAQWQRFMAVCDEIPYQKEEIPVGVSQVPDDEGQFRYLCGIEVSRFGDLPRGLEPAKISACRYAVFAHDTHVSGLYETYSRIWNEILPNLGVVVADAPVIERHNPTFNPATGEGGLTLWIPLVN